MARWRGGAQPGARDPATGAGEVGVDAEDEHRLGEERGHELAVHLAVEVGPGEPAVELEPALGDVGRQDPDGRVWISGRAKDLIISGGYNVYPKEVELVLDELPGVVESAVIGLPHPDFGEGVVAVIAGAGDEAAMIAEARGQLAAFKVPKRIFFVEDLPRNAMGKVQKALLRQTYKDAFA